MSFSIDSQHITYLTSCLEASAKLSDWIMTKAARPSPIPDHSAKIVVRNTTTDPRPIPKESTPRHLDRGIQLTVISPPQPVRYEPLEIQQSVSSLRTYAARITHIRVVVRLKFVYFPIKPILVSPLHSERSNVHQTMEKFIKPSKRRRKRY